MGRIFPAALLLLIVFVARLPVLHRAVLDWDETVYFMMAQAWLQGHLPYTTVWDNKPPGIYAIFALFQAFIPGIEAIRAAASLCIAILSWTVLEITTTVAKSRIAGWVAALLLILCSFTNDGLSSNTELFMECFIALAVLCVLRDGPARLTGLLLGCGFLVKYVCAPECLMVLALLWARRRQAGPIISALLASIIPLAAFSLLYAIAGKLPLLWNCAVEANFRRAAMIWRPERLSLQAERWSTLYAVGLWVIGWALLQTKRSHQPLGTPNWFLSAWLLATLIGAVSAKAFFDHYFLQMLPPLCVAVGVAFSHLPARSLWVRLGFVALVAAQPLSAALIALHHATGPDSERETAASIRAANGTSLYVFDAQPILYHLTGLPAPTYYPFPSELTGLALAPVAGVDPVKEVARILATNPEFIVVNSWRRDMAGNNPAVYAELYAALAAHYTLWEKFPGNHVYKLN